MISHISSVFLQEALLSFILTSIFYKVASKRSWFDKDPHNIHQNKSPQVVSYGGIAIFISFWLGMVLIMPRIFVGNNNLWLFIASSVILIVGIIDDALELNPLQKTIGILIAANLLYFKADIEFSSTLLPMVSEFWFKVLSYSATMIWIFAVTNAINLIDGVDGLASSVLFVSLITLAITTYFFSLSIRMTFLMMLIILAAAIIGFLPYNWAPAKMYLGDTGALFIGFMYASLSVSNLKNASSFSLLVPVLIYLLPLFDASYAMIRRFLTRKPMSMADKDHLHHRLLRFGLSKSQVVWSMIFITIIFSVIAIVSHIFPSLRILWLMVAVIVIIFLMLIMKHLSNNNR